MRDITDQYNRRSFLRRAGSIGAVGATAAIAGCAEDDPDDDDSGSGAADPDDLGEQLPAVTYLNNPENYNPARHDAINLVADQLEEVGLEVDVEVLEWGTLLGQVTEDYDYGISTWSRGLGVDPATRIVEMFHSRNTGPGEGNFYGYEDDTVDELLDAQQMETDPAARRDQWQEIQQEISADVPMTPIIEVAELMAYNNETWENFEGHIRGFNYLWTMMHIEPIGDDDELWGTWAEVLENLSPVSNVRTQTKVRVQNRMIYDYLVRFDDAVEPDPDLSLAEDWELEDETTVVYHLRDHQWHDGEELTAEDVAFTYNYIQEYEMPAFAVQRSLYEDAEVIDDRTVQLNLTQPVGPLHQILSAEIAILPKHIWEDIDNPLQEVVEEPVGSGVMQFDYWDRGEEFSLVRNDDHWIEMPFSRRLWQIIPEESTNWQLLRDGEIDYLPFSRVGRQLFENQDEPNISIAETPSDSWWHFSMNLREEPLGELPVRQALAHAIPKTAVRDQLQYGFGEIGTSVVTSAFEDLYTDDITIYEEGVDNGLAVMEDAGFLFDEDGYAHYPN